MNFDAWNLNAPINTHVNVQADHKKSSIICAFMRIVAHGFMIYLYSVIREIGTAGTVLLKNEGNVLPLNAPRSIALVGSAAGPSSLGPNG